MVKYTHLSHTDMDSSQSPPGKNENVLVLLTQRTKIFEIHRSGRSPRTYRPSLRLEMHEMN